MSPPAPAPGGNSRAALGAGVACYLLWGTTPILFIVISRAGASPWETLGQRALWSISWAALLVALAGQGAQVRRVFTQPRLLGMLALSALLIGTNWGIYVWAVSDHRVLESSLGYYINPLMVMAVGVVFFHERIDWLGYLAMGLAALGVVLQTVALGHPPMISLLLAASFCAYGVIRRQIPVDAQAGLFVECLLMLLPAIGLLVWLHGAGMAVFGVHLAPSLLLAAAGPATVAPLALFAWTARRLPFSTIGFLQFIGPTMGFAIGVASGESLTPLRAISFGFIWAGAATFAIGAWRVNRRIQPSAA
jgi:chloramphenicol-sensitive protein RarD